MNIDNKEPSTPSDFQIKSMVVALTGGIGSGKTLVSDHFAKQGAAVIDTDIVARKVVEPGQACLAKLVESFGSGILLNNGELNRASLRDIAFSNAANKRTLDAITHPAIFHQSLSQIAQTIAPYCIVVIPLLSADSQFINIAQRVLSVAAPKEIRIQRVQQRNNFSRKQVEDIMQTQLNDAQRREFSDDEIINDSDKLSVYAAVEKLHKKYLALSHRFS